MLTAYSSPQSLLGLGTGAAGFGGAAPKPPVSPPNGSDPPNGSPPKPSDLNGSPEKQGYTFNWDR